MYLLYSLALSLTFLILLPYFAYQAVRYGKYAASFVERLGFLPESLPTGDGKTIWIHAVSVGEFLTALPLIGAIKQSLPDYKLAVSTTTLTGQRLAGQHLIADPAISRIFYFPFDWTFTVSRALDRVNPAAVIVLETELWPNFLNQCRCREIPVALVNGRISLRSFKRYQIIGPFIARVVSNLSLAIMQSEEDAERMKALGADPTVVRVCGNLKLDATPIQSAASTEKPSSKESKEPGAADSDASARPPAGQSGNELAAAFNLADARNLIVAGSTAPGEEEMLLESLATIKKTPVLSDTRILIAPRHPERFDDVARLIEKKGFSVTKRTDAPRAIFGNGDRPDVLLLDTIGELARVYEFASVVFVGGSLVDRGGHNIIEPAAYAKPIIVGPFTNNFRQIISDFRRESAVVQLEPGSREELAIALTEQLISLLSDSARAAALGSRAQGLLGRSQGATSCTMDAIRELLGATGVH